MIEADKFQYKEIIEVMGVRDNFTKIYNTLNRVHAHTDDETLRYFLAALIKRDVPSVFLLKQSIVDLFKITEAQYSLDNLFVDSIDTENKIRNELEITKIKYLYFYCLSKAYKTNKYHDILAALESYINKCLNQGKLINKTL